ncbi:MAG: YwmB family TATA-box binding protein [Eubacteriales bacterium]
MGLKKKILVVLLICVVLAPVIILIWAFPVTIDGSDGAAIVRVFKASGTRFNKLELNGWVVINRAFLTEDSGRKYFDAKVRKLFRPEAVPTIKLVSENGFFSAEAEGAVGQGLTARVALHVKPVNHGGDGKAYLVLSLRTENPQCSFKNLEKISREFFKENQFHKSLVISGYFSGEMSPPGANEVLRKMLAAAHAQNVEALANGQLVSITAFSPDVRQQLTGNKKSGNINMALRYNSVEKRTFVYIGSPIITSEY